MSCAITVVRKLPTPVPREKISTVMYKFNQNNPTSCQVDMNDLDGETVMIKGRQADIELSWGALVKLTETVEAKSGTAAPVAPIAEWTNRSGATYLRPTEIFQGKAVCRFDDGRIYLIGHGALLVDALDWIVRQFGKQEGACPFFAEPVWHGDELHKFGYPQNSMDLCRIDHFDHGQDHYWQNAACDNIWKSLSGRVIDKFQTYTTMGTCCRNERRQYYFLERLKVFRMREIVAVGSPADTQAFRGRALAFVHQLNDDLQLNAHVEAANDPFFLQDNVSIETVRGKYDVPDLVKIEYRPELYDGKSLACASFNVHGDFFSQNLGYQGGKTWTSCAAFGLERLAWAVMVQHGHSLADWPSVIRTAIEAVNTEQHH
jgi:seryl-tRNA synthetase